MSSKVYLVGGAVRDGLLGIPPRENDWVVTGATPEQMLEQGYKQVGKDFPVFLHPESGEEYALARTERKTGKGYTGFECFSSPDVTLEEDLGRRDLTINAMARSEDGELLDPFGGQQDINNKLLRHVSDAFIEDPLRVLRVARFAARYFHLGFKVADETRALMQEIVNNGELDHLVTERVWMETEKALMEQNPQQYFAVLRDCGALKVLFPELDALFGVPQRVEYHPEIDSGIHVLMCLEQAAKLNANLATRFAVLCHDYGKALTPKDTLPRHIGHEHKGLKPVKQCCDRLRVPNELRDLALLVCELHLLSHRIEEMKPATVLKYFKKMDLYRKPDRLEEFLLACECDSRGRKGFEDRDYPQAELWRKYFTASCEIDTKSLQQQGLKGEAFGKAIEQQRLAQMEKIKQQLNDSQ